MWISTCCAQDKKNPESHWSEICVWIEGSPVFWPYISLTSFDIARIYTGVSASIAPHESLVFLVSIFHQESTFVCWVSPKEFNSMLKTQTPYPLWNCTDLKHNPAGEWQHWKQPHPGQPEKQSACVSSPPPHSRNQQRSFQTTFMLPLIVLEKNLFVFEQRKRKMTKKGIRCWWILFTQREVAH